MSLKKYFLSLITTLFTLVGFGVSKSIYAVGDPRGLRESFDKVIDIQSKAGVKTLSVPEILVSVSAFVAALAGVLAVLAIIIGAFYYIGSFGNAGKTETGKKMILNAIIGLIILGLAAVTVNAVVRFFAG